MKYRSAIILCGGKGTRLGELGKKFPKTLIKIQGKPILWYIINSLKKNNFNHFILPTGYKAKQIERFFYLNRFRNCKFDIINTGVNSTIAKRIYKVKKFILSKDFIILNGDAIFETNLNKIFQKHRKKDIDMSFICCEAEADFGTIGVLNKKVINFERSLNFVSVSTSLKNFKAHVYSGMAIINKKILKENFENYMNFEKDFYPKVIKKFKTDIHTLKGFWYAMDNIKHFNNFNKIENNIKIYNRIFKLKKKFNDK